MTFTITYRGADGALRTEAVEAASRADCLAQMKARGVTVLGVKESSKKDKRGGCSKRKIKSSGSNGHGEQESSGKRTVAYAALITLFLLICGTWWWCCHHELYFSKPKLPKDVEKVKVGRRTSASVHPIDKPRTAISDTNVASVTTTAIDYEKDQSIRKPGRNHTSQAYTNDPYFAGHESNMVFKTAADQMLAMIWSSGNSMMAPLPLTSSTRVESDFRTALVKPIEFADDDSTAVRETKKQIHELRGEILALLDKGYTVQQILMDHQSLYNENMQLRNSVLLERDRIFDSGDADGAREYVRRVNDELAKLGINAIPNPVPAAQRRLSKREKTARRIAEEAAATKKSEQLNQR